MKEFLKVWSIILIAISAIVSLLVGGVLLAEYLDSINPVYESIFVVGVFIFVISGLIAALIVVD